MNKTIVLTFLLFANIIAFAQNFKIEGTVEGLENGTWLYLKLSSPQDMIDSTQVANGKFTLKGKLAEPATQVVLLTKNYTNYVFFWLENKNKKGLCVPDACTCKNGVGIWRLGLGLWH